VRLKTKKKTDKNGQNIQDSKDLRITFKKNNETMGGRGRVELWKVLETKESGKNLRLGAWGREMKLRK
jgi:hypothetical protein